MIIRTPDLIVDPVANPTINEVLFWERIMKEHALFIRLGLPCDQVALINEAQRLYDLFEQLEQEAPGVVPATLPDYIARVRCAVEQIWAFKRYILHLLLECRFGGSGSLYPLLMDHISREAAYFIKVLDKLATGQTSLPIDSIVQENVFWLRIMADHASFIRGLLDPSERRLYNVANEFTDEFGTLLAQARDIESMLWNFRPTNELRRFEGDAEKVATRMRDFARQATELLENCAALALIPPLLADHIRRETEHFLEILEVINQMIC